MSGLQVRSLERLCHDPAAMRRTFLSSNVLVEKAWLDWPAPSWDEPAIIALADGECVAAINWSKDDKQLRAVVEFAFCDPAHPAAFAACAIAFRKAVRAANLTSIRFSCHPENGPMMKLARKLKLAPISMSFKVEMP